MKKKLCLYFKLVVLSVIIFSMILPSFATLSSSDGSAFVTKAEFDALAAEMNSRLSTFEAGINSKIDSQVTSYLDRNGIWSGKDQDIVTNEVSFQRKGKSYTVDSSSGKSYSYYQKGGSTNVTLSSTSQSFYPIVMTQKYVKMDCFNRPINKSGMLQIVAELLVGKNGEPIYAMNYPDYGDHCNVFYNEFGFANTRNPITSDEVDKADRVWCIVLENMVLNAGWFDHAITTNPNNLIYPFRFADFSMPIVLSFFVAKNSYVYAYEYLDFATRSNKVFVRYDVANNGVSTVLTLKSAKVY